nr:MAG TPA: helix-turn-helix XRE-family like protein [Caudoviricetes sp.]
MTPNTPLLNESFQTATPWGFIRTEQSATSVSGFLVKYISISVSEADSRKDLPGTPIQELIRKHEKNPARAAALSKARQRIADRINNAFPLAKLRLSKGLSQAQLASLMEVEQPYIAKIEKGNADLQMSTIERLAVALNVEQNVVFKALQEQRSLTKENE